MDDSKPEHADEVRATSGEVLDYGDDEESLDQKKVLTAEGDMNNNTGHKDSATDSVHGDQDGESELNRSREYVKSAKVPQDSDEDKAKSRNLWLSNLASHVKASDLTALVAPHGVTDGAKVIVSNRDQDSPFGFVTMSTVEAADECVKKLDGMEWNGKTLKVEKICRDPTVAATNGVNGNNDVSKNRPSSRRSGDAGSKDSNSGRIAASDRRRLGAKNGVVAASNTAVDVGANAAGANGSPTKEKDIEYYRRKARRDFDTIRELQATIERNRRRATFQLQKERERASRIEAQSRTALRRERESLASERDLLDKRRSDLDRLERLLKDRERQLDERERNNEYLNSRQGGGSSRQAATLPSSNYGSSQQSGRYYSNAPSSATKRSYDGNSSGTNWDNGGASSKRAAARSDYPDRQQYRGSDRGGGSGRDYAEDRGGNGSYDDSSYNSRNPNSNGGRRTGPITSSSVAHWQKPVSHRPPPFSGNRDVEAPAGASDYGRGRRF